MLSSYFCLFVLTRSWVEETPTTHNGVGGKITKKKTKQITKTSCTVQGEEGNKPLYLIILYQNRRKMVKTKI